MSSIKCWRLLWSLKVLRGSLNDDYLNRKKLELFKEKIFGLESDPGMITDQVKNKK
jgi:hypothetical protein